MHDAAEVVGVVDDIGVGEGDGVDGDDGRGRVGPVLRQRRPEELAVVVDPADVVLDVAWRGECRVGNALALAVVDENVRVSGAWRAIRAVDDDIPPVRDRLLGPVAAPENVAIFANVDHAFRLARVAFKGDVLDRVPYRRPA